MIKGRCRYCDREVEIYTPVAVFEIEDVVYALNFENVRAFSVFHKKCWDKFVEERKKAEG